MQKLLILLLALVLFACDKKGEDNKTEGSTGAFVWKEVLEMKDIPNTPIKGMLNGAEFKPEYINFETWRGSGDNVLNFGNKAPQQNCGFVENDAAIHLTRKAGDIKQGPLTKANFESKLDGYLANYHYYKDPENMVKIEDAWNCALEITEIGEKTVKGKIAICFKDEKKSWIAGTFEAIRCNN